MNRLRPVLFLFACLIALGVAVDAFAASEDPLPSGVYAVDNNPSKPTFGTPLAQDGLSWDSAFNNIQDGIDAAFANGGGEVWVADGTYGEGRAQSYGSPGALGSLLLQTNVEVYGGFQGWNADDFVGNETALGQRSITQGVSVIDGSTARGGSPAYHVVAVGNELSAVTGAVLDGFHVTGGLASSAATSAYHLNRGAGIYIYGSSPIIRNCTIYGNTARVGGGGIALISNPATTDPANATIENCVIYNNTAERNPDEDGNPIVGGGGIFVDAGDGTVSANPDIRYCTFSGNTATADVTSSFGTGSDAIYTWVNGNGCSPTVSHSIFWPNTATSIKSEGAMGSTVPLPYDGGCSVSYSIVNAAYACPAYVNESDPSPGLFAWGCGTGNITSDPQFTGTAPEFPLTGGSPAQNIGVLLTPGTDIQGLTRNSPDIGAYEGDGTLVGPTASIDAAALAPTTQYVPQSYNLNNDNGSLGSLPVRIVWDIDDDGAEDFSTINPTANYTSLNVGTVTARLVLSNGVGSSVDTVTFTLAEPVTVAAPTPNNPTLNSYDAASFTVAGASSPLGGFPPYNYQWQFSTDNITWGTTFRDGTAMSDGAHSSVRPGRNPAIPAGDPGSYLVTVPWTITGVNTATLNIDHALRGVHNGYYRCVVTDSQFGTLGIAEGRVNSSATQLTLNDKLIILDPPTSLELYEGNPSSIDVTVFGGTAPAANYSYSWFLFDPVSTQDLTILNSNVDPYEFVADADPPVETIGGWVSGTGSPGFYSLTVSDNTVGGVNLTNLQVDVAPAVDVAITTPTVDLTKNTTESVTLTTTISGGYPGYTYVWTYNSALLEDGQPHPSGSGATVSGATTGTLVISGLEVADAGNYAVQVVDSKGDTMTLSDPCPAENGLCSDIDTVAVQVTNNLIVLNDPVSFDVYAGDTVSFEVTAGGGDPGSYTFDWFFETEDGFGPFTMPIVGPNPGSQTGSNVAISSVGDTSTLTVSNVGVEVVPTIRGDEGNYYCTVNDGVGINQPDTSQDGVLQVFRPVTVTTQPQNAVVYQSEDATFSVQASGGINNSRNFQWQVDTGSGFADIVGATSSTLTLVGVALSDDGNQYRCRVTAPNSDVTTASSNYQVFSAAASLSVSDALNILTDPMDVVTYTTSPDFDLVSTFLGGTPFASAPVYQTEWRRVGVSPAGPDMSAGAGILITGTPNTASLTVTPSAVGVGVYNYRVAITDQVDTQTSANARVEIAVMPSFSKPLVDSQAPLGGSFTWSVIVDGGVQPLDYEWEHQVDDGNKALVWLSLPGNGPSYTINPVTEADAGLYRVTVTDDLGTTIQSQATLSLGAALPLAGGLGLAALAALSALGGAMAIRRRK